MNYLLASKEELQLKTFFRHPQTLIFSFFAFFFVHIVVSQVSARPVQDPSHKQAYSVSSGTYNGGPSIETNVFSTRVQVSSAGWLRLHFNSANLGTGSYIDMISVKDGSHQTLNAL